MEDCEFFDLSVADIQPDEALPLLKHSSPPLFYQNFEMAPVHKSKYRFHISDTFRDKSEINPSLDVDAKSSYFQIPSRANVIEALQTFWKKKLTHENTGVGSFSSEALICYTAEPVTHPPHTCYITLPNGCCFGNLLSECNSQAEARQSAAYVAFVNSLFNELPCRRINDVLINTVIHEATVASRTLHGRNVSSEGIGVFRSILESSRGQTMLDYTAFVNRLLVMHWSGTLESMSRCGASRQQVLDAASSGHWFSEDNRSEMALTWIAIERQDPGTIDDELTKATSELEAAQHGGRELAFPRLKKDVLQLAASQVS